MRWIVPLCVLPAGGVGCVICTQSLWSHQPYGGCWEVCHWPFEPAPPNTWAVPSSPRAKPQGAITAMQLVLIIYRPTPPGFAYPRQTVGFVLECHVFIDCRVFSQSHATKNTHKNTHTYWNRKRCVVTSFFSFFKQVFKTQIISYAYLFSTQEQSRILLATDLHIHFGVRR